MAILTTRLSVFGRTETQFENFGTTVITDAAKAKGGQGENPNPAQLLAAAWAACTMTVVTFAARKMEISAEGCWAEVTDLEEDLTTNTITRIAMRVHLPAALDEAQRKRMEAYALRGCFVGNSLTAQRDEEFVYDV